MKKLSIIALLLGLVGALVAQRVVSTDHSKCTTFTLGQRIYTLTVDQYTGGAALTFEATTTIYASAEPPVVTAGDDISSCVGSKVALTAAGTYDPMGLALTYSWTFQAVPTGSGSKISGRNSKDCTIVPDLPGDYTLSLLVKAADGREAADSVTVHAEYCDYTPHAVIEGEGTIKTLLPATVTLDGSSSYTADGEITGYSWSLEKRPAGSASSIANNAAASIELPLDVPGEYQVSLVVRNQAGLSAPAVHTLSVSDGDPPEMALQVARKTISALFVKKDTLHLAILLTYKSDLHKDPAEYLVFRRGVGEKSFGPAERTIAPGAFAKDSTTGVLSFAFDEDLQPGAG
ncbi:MAG TPA: PKD domain-containing protein, partial [Candidatus Aminicenantes bacterium]|nr:PKD domain-containing protein [Candidatus Aminicenantes bacterium]